MADIIQAWGAYGPRLVPTQPVMPETVIEQLVATTNQSRGSILAVLCEMDALIEHGLKEGRIVQLPNGTHYRPTARKDGSIRVRVRVTPRLTRGINAEFRGEWINGENIGLDGDEIVALWNEAHPEDPVV